MSRKSKIDPVLKVQLVEQYLRDEIGVREAGRLVGLMTPVEYHENYYAAA